MKILFLAKIFPYPPDSGVKIKTYKILQLLSKRHKIYLISFKDERDIWDDENKTKTFCRSVTTFIKPIISGHKIETYRKLFMSIILVKPFVVYKFYFKEVKEHVHSFLKNNNIDFIYIDNTQMAQYIPSWFKGRLICDTNEILYKTYLDFSQSEKNLVKKLFLYGESKKLEKYERYWLPKFNHVFTISNLDKNEVTSLGIPKENVSFLPIPYKTKNLFKNKLNSEGPIITFIASLSWLPNKQGIEWFINNVFGLVKQEVSNARLLIVGKDAKIILKKYIKELNIELLDYQKDLTDIYRKTSVFIVPILSGGGIRVKILEALSYGMSVVTTSKGIQGIEVTHEREVLITSIAADFARAVIILLKNRKQAEDLSNNALRFMKNRYNQSLTLKILKKFKHYN